MPERATSLRERKQQATRERLITVAFDLFAKRGYDDTTMEAIAEGADVSRATVFNYFPRKEEFITAYIEQRRGLLRELLESEQARGVDTITRLNDALRLLAETLEADPLHQRAWIRAWLAGRVLLLPGSLTTADIFADTLRAGQERGEIRDDLDPDSMAQLLLDAYYGALIRWATDDTTGPDAITDLGAQLRTVSELVVASFAPQAAD